ncbi:uncharacterized protein Z519_02673 [Cladophialophora bantiana CBS 173.52]|uniref:Uncharacterized protein n=1 Tax=Cladophialophora bantiana (strain ATCC 10958 / CBS 173.52 / CDC B-1940 / NIH 8579) TaxID=1442370 RepID=A0A0D2F4V2_CLAB1|nr:uncharacterized protein Z519_02673 [Cladophialophora bantiana CBS 173.52]KIW97281.1 hypothetical protein Z519_02673 [Cladophialophora bantiana CBS 173.52]
MPLAFLHGFLSRKRNISVREGRQFSDARALVLLRGLELFCDHLSDTRDRQHMAKVFLDVHPLLHEARQRSHTINGLTLYLNDIFRGRASQSLTSRVPEHKSTVDGRSWFMDGDDLVSFNDDSLIAYHPSECRMNVARCEGWFIVIETDEQPPWTSSFLGLSLDETVRKVFPRLLDRLEQGSPPIHPDNTR